MSREIKVTVGDYDFTVAYTFYPGAPAKLNGPWENCYEEEPPEIDIEAISIGDIEVYDILSDDTIIKIEDEILEYEGNPNDDWI